MSRYEQLAQTWWSTNRPAELSLMTDPDAFFSTLAAQIEGRIAAVQDLLAGPDPAGETYLGKVGRLNAARSQAEEVALDELVWSLGPEEEPQEETSELGAVIVAAHRLVSDALA
jgi:hypothetical protein